MPTVNLSGLSIARKPWVARMLTIAMIATASPYCSAQFFTRMNTQSMAPTMLKNQRVLNTPRPTFPLEIKRRMIISYKTPLTQGKFFVARVVGLSKDVIEVKKGLLYVNGKAADDPDIISSLRAADCINQLWDMNNFARLFDDKQLSKTKFTIPDGEFYVMTDNRALPFVDSRYLGSIKFDQIVNVLRPLNLTGLQKIENKDCVSEENQQ